MVFPAFCERAVKRCVNAGKNSEKYTLNCLINCDLSIFFINKIQ